MTAWPSFCRLQRKLLVTASWPSIRRCSMHGKPSCLNSGNRHERLRMQARQGSAINKQPSIKGVTMEKSKVRFVLPLLALLGVVTAAYAGGWAIITLNDIPD